MGTARDVRVATATGTCACTSAVTAINELTMVVKTTNRARVMMVPSESR
jgi:hypothetical protein